MLSGSLSQPNHMSQPVFPQCWQYSVLLQAKSFILAYTSLVTQATLSRYILLCMIIQVYTHTHTHIHTSLPCQGPAVCYIPHVAKMGP